MDIPSGPSISGTSRTLTMKRETWSQRNRNVTPIIIVMIGVVKQHS